MNRRAALKALATVAGATGLTVTPVTTQEAQGVELVILKTTRPMDQEEAECLRRYWESAVSGTSLAQVRAVVLESGLEVEVVRTKA